MQNNRKIRQNNIKKRQPNCNSKKPKYMRKEYKRTKKSHYCYQKPKWKAIQHNKKMQMQQKRKVLLN